MKLCLNMIVRNESDKIIRALTSALPYISCYAIADTGSTDDTIDKIVSFFKEHGIKGEILQTTFKNFSQARNEALELAVHMWKSGKYNFQHLLLMDADMELVVDVQRLPKLTGVSYDMIQRSGGISYANRRIMNVLACGRYVGATHEYLNVPSAGMLEGARFIDHADGSNRTNKLVRDAELLEADVKSDPKNGRAWYYLGQTYRESEKWDFALAAYNKRVELGGWEEETWSAMVNVAHCKKALGDRDGFISGMLQAYAFRPTRAEALYDLAKVYREDNQPLLGSMFAQLGRKIPRPNDGLFVSDFVYNTGLDEEFSICGWYDEKTRAAAFDACNKVALDPKSPAHSRHLAKQNMVHYLTPLVSHAPSFTAKVIDFKPPVGWTAMNPSVVTIDGRSFINVRCVNYTIQPDGSYKILDKHSISEEHPIRTRNFLVPSKGSSFKAKELDWDWPVPEYKLVRELEDVRLWADADDVIHGVANARELNENGKCEQVLFDIDWEKSRVINARVMLPGSPNHEKNWMPINGRQSTFMYDCVTTYAHKSAGSEMVRHPSKIDTTDVRGSSQLVPYKEGFLAVVHEAVVRKDNSRVYYHRFAWFDSELRLHRLSLPFVFEAKQIEFCAGLAWNGGKLLLSYGVTDNSAKIGTIDPTDVSAMLVREVD